MKIFFLIIFIAVIGSTSQAQWLTSPDFKEHAQKGINFVYDLDFERAQIEFEFLAQHYPSHPAGKFFLAMIDWWSILLNVDDESHDDAFVKKLDGVIELCDSLLDNDDNDVVALFFKGGALGFRGRLRANRSSWIKAANDGRLALPIVQQAYKIAPDNKDILLGIGIYNYYASTIPERYPIVKPVMIFFPAGDKKKGIQQLWEASLNAEFAAIEAKYFLLQLHFTYERQYDTAYSLASSLLSAFPNNAIFHRYLGRSAFMLQKYDEAVKIFSEILTRCGRHQRGYTPLARRDAVYYLGLCKMNSRNYDEALQFLYESDEFSRELDTIEQSGYMAMTNLKIGMIYDIQKKRQYAIMQYQKVLDMKKFEATHELAQRYLKSPYTP